MQKALSGLLIFICAHDTENMRSLHYVTTAVKRKSRWFLGALIVVGIASIAFIALTARSTDKNADDDPYADEKNWGRS